jgi:hypothetical protein
MGGYTRDLSGQRLGKHVPAKQTQRPLLGSRFLIMQQLDYNNGKDVFSAWSVPRCYKRDKVRAKFSSVRQSEEKSQWELVATVLSWKSGSEEKTLCVWIIRWGCHTSCVKIRCQETTSGVYNKLRALAWVCQWSVKCSHKSWVYKWSINRVTNPNPVYSYSYTWQYN